MPIYTIDRRADLIYYSELNARVVARDSSGIFYCAYIRWMPAQQSILISRSNDDGVTWSVDSEIVDPGLDYDVPSLAVGSDDTLHLTAFHQGAGMVYLRRPSGGVWSAEELIFATIVSYSSAMAIDSNNNIHFVSERLWGLPLTQGIVYHQRTALGWQPEETVQQFGGGVNQQHGPAIAIDTVDNIHIVWHGLGWAGFPLRYQVVYRFRSVAGVWQVAEQLSSINEHQDVNQIAVDRLGDIHVVWQGIVAGPNTHFLRYRRKTGGAWDAIIEFLLNWISGAIAFVTNTVTHDNRVYVQYKQWDGGGLEQGYHREVIGGAAFGAEVQDTNFPLGGFPLGELIGIFATYPVIDGYSMTNPISGAPFVGFYVWGGADYEVFINTGLWHSPAPPAPPPPTTPTVITRPATNITEHSARLNGIVSDDGGRAGSVKFQWGMTSSYGMETSLQQGGFVSGSIFSADLPSLAEGVAYHFRAVFQSNPIVYGQDMAFSTLVPEGPVTFITEELLHLLEAV